MTDTNDTPETTYRIRYWLGPLDGGNGSITCGYPPNTLNGYELSYSMNGRYYLYTWPRQTPAPAAEGSQA